MNMSQKMTYPFTFAFIVLGSLLSFIGIQNVVAASGPAFLKVIVLVNNTGGGTAQPSSFEIYIDGDAEPPYITGSQKGSISLLTPGTHTIEVRNIIISNIPYSTEFSGNCIGKGLKSGEIAIKPGDKKTCIITLSYPNFD
jgi:hypothetical protein